MLPQLMIPSEAAHDTVASLGELGLLQFKDLNQDKSAFQRTYANQVSGRLRRHRSGDDPPALLRSSGPTKWHAS